MAAITISDLTTGTETLEGSGVFDIFMRAVGTHVEREYSKSRIKGTEYAQVYLGAIQSAMDRSLQLLLSKEKTDLEAQLLEEQIQNAIKQGLQIDAQTALINQQAANALTENDVLVAQKCKLEAEFDLLVEQKLKAIQETALLAQKKVTEQAQTTSTGVDADSVIGRQKLLYDAQTKGFTRDAEQKAAKLLADVWSVQRTTDNGIAPNADNALIDTNIGRAVNKLLTGINA